MSIASSYDICHIVKNKVKNKLDLFLHTNKYLNQLRSEIVSLKNSNNTPDSLNINKQPLTGKGPSEIEKNIEFIDRILDQENKNLQQYKRDLNSFNTKYLPYPSSLKDITNMNKTLLSNTSNMISNIKDIKDDLIKQRAELNNLRSLSKITTIDFLYYVEHKPFYLNKENISFSEIDIQCIRNMKKIYDNIWFKNVEDNLKSKLYSDIIKKIDKEKPSNKVVT
ncbi:hypothetical protein KTP48_05455 [Proteus mirabilis]|uniref:hypothetical protein n=1 Tax=Proteus mirabilis TaxID=584 RepID=UPI001C2C6F47|nr:hypothetical protein [Proteus mirabilis]MBU9978185.1 hypothetical protein [Proteus mirabilis]